LRLGLPSINVIRGNQGAIIAPEQPAFGMIT